MPLSLECYNCLLKGQYSWYLIKAIQPKTIQTLHLTIVFTPNSAQLPDPRLIMCIQLWQHLTETNSFFRVLS